MKQNSRKIVIIGGGIAGLCTAVYAQKCGYQAEVLEMHEIAGGLATSWRRGGYTFETCLHWLLGSKPGAEMHSQWQEVMDIDKLTFVNSEEFVRIENERGEGLSFYTNVDRLEAGLLKHAPQDAAPIRRFTHAIRSLSHFKLPDPGGSWMANARTMLRDAPCLPLLKKLSNLTGKEYGEGFTDPILKCFFGGGEMGHLSVIALIFSLAWMNAGNAGYSIGGSQAIIRLIQEKLVSLGGTICFGTKVKRIIVEGDRATGVELASGEIVGADWVVSAADGHATIFELLGGKYADRATHKTYSEMATFSSYVQVSLGVALDLKTQPPMTTVLLETPFRVDPGTELGQISYRFFHFDPTFAPVGRTAVTSFLPTRNFEYWTHLEKSDAEAYRTEKQRIAEAVIAILEKRIPDVRRAIQVTDVSTPATVIRFTGNWKGSMEGWLLTPGTGFKPLRNTLPGLERFLMVGQWVMPGGGLPSGLLTARPAIQSICKEDRVPFSAR
jgi:phytoene dehydrogenase-like protein